MKAGNFNNAFAPTPQPNAPQNSQNHVSQMLKSVQPHTQNPGMMPQNNQIMPRNQIMPNPNRVNMGNTMPNNPMNPMVCYHL